MMRAAIILLGIIGCGLTPAASAEVVSSGPTSFVIAQSVTIAKPRAEVWAMLRTPQKWWAKEHTYSGDSANLYLDSQATGCFCEKLPGKGSVEHARVVFLSAPGTLRLQGALGPLQAQAVIGTLTFTLEAQDDDTTRVKMTYVVGGYIQDGAEAMASPVDEVMAVQLLALKSAAEGATPDAGPTAQ